MTTAIYWPSSSVNPRASVMFHPEVPSRSGGMSITGSEQVTQSYSGQWHAVLKFHVGRGQSRGAARPADSILAWRAMLAKLQGRAGALLIGPQDALNSPAGVAGEIISFNTPHADNALFSDGAGYDQFASPAHAGSAGAIGATSLTIVMEAGHSPEAGQYFGIGQRLYLISSAIDQGSDSWLVGFWPELRVAVVESDIVNFDSPVCIMRFKTDDVAELTLQNFYMGDTPTLDLVEASPES